ncbi:MAG: hypothetical protein ACLPXB_07740, partial [Thiobacillaceae bacterium]
MHIVRSILKITLIAVGCSAPAAFAEGRYYDPSNIGGNTTGYELFNTIGCPGKALLDKGCDVPVAAKPAPAPEPPPPPPPPPPP